MFNITMFLQDSHLRFEKCYISVPVGCTLDDNKQLSNHHGLPTEVPLKHQLITTDIFLQASSFWIIG